MLTVIIVKPLNKLDKQMECEHLCEPKQSMVGESTVLALKTGRHLSDPYAGPTIDLNDM
jgi:hypothetical protein